METRTTPGPAILVHHDAMLGTLRAGGLTLPQTAHAYAVIDAFVYGFALPEASLPTTPDAELPDLAEEILGDMDPVAYPHLAEFTAATSCSPAMRCRLGDRVEARNPSSRPVSRVFSCVVCRRQTDRGATSKWQILGYL